MDVLCVVGCFFSLPGDCSLQVPVPFSCNTFLMMINVSQGCSLVIRLNMVMRIHKHTHTYINTHVHTTHWNIYIETHLLLTYCIIQFFQWSTFVMCSDEQCTDRYGHNDVCTIYFQYTIAKGKLVVDCRVPVVLHGRACRHSWTYADRNDHSNLLMYMHTQANACTGSTRGRCMRGGVNLFSNGDCMRR